jgi:hypothetical protein
VIRSRRQRRLEREYRQRDLWLAHIAEWENTPLKVIVEASVPKRLADAFERVWRAIPAQIRSEAMQRWRDEELRLAIKVVENLENGGQRCAGLFQEAVGDAPDRLLFDAAHVGERMSDAEVHYLCAHELSHFFQSVLVQEAPSVAQREANADRDAKTWGFERPFMLATDPDPDDDEGQDPRSDDEP